MGVTMNHKDIDIKVSRGNEYRTLTMDIYNENDFFHGMFKSAARVVTEIVNRSERVKSSGSGSIGSSGHDMIQNFPNNIISFCAERGQGKTSAMLSMSKALREISGSNDRKHIDFWNDNAVLGTCRTCPNPVLESRFEILDPIDPTMMEETDSIIKNVISKMFKTAEEKWKDHIDHSFYSKKDIAYDPSKKEKILRKFVECFRGADRLNGDGANSSASYDDLNMLAEYGDSTNFKKSLSELVELYLDFTAFGSSPKNSFLVIQIDDADLNIKNAHAISEEIRKYFVMPNVIVLMALNTETMRFIIEQYFLSQYGDYINFGAKDLIKDKCHEIAEKYIEKLMPTAHRINIPKVDDYIRDGFNHIKLHYTDSDEENETGYPRDIIEIDDGLVKYPENKDDYQEKLIALIYQKTGIILIKPEYYLHEFLPSNMRMLNHFISYISEMDDVIRYDNGTAVGSLEYIFEQIKKYVNNKDEAVLSDILALIEKYLANIKSFYDYFLYSWCNLTLSREQLEVVETISRTSRAWKNQRTLELLNLYISRKSEMNDVKEVSVTEYVPFSMIVSRINDLRKLDNPQNELKLIYAVEIYYTIYLHKLLFESLKSWLNKPDDIEKKTPFNDLVDFVGYSIFPISYYDKARIKRIKIKNGKDKYNSEYGFCYSLFNNYFCEMVNNTNVIRYDKAAVKTIDSDKSFVFTCNSAYFDVLRPIISILVNDSLANVFLKDNKGYSLGIIVSSLNIIINTDFQDLLYEKVFNIIEGKTATGNKNGVIDNISGLYNYMDSAVHNNSTVLVNSTISNMIERTDRNTIFDIEYLSCLTVDNSKGEKELLTTIFKSQYTYKGDEEYEECSVSSQLLQELLKSRDENKADPEKSPTGRETGGTGGTDSQEDITTAESGIDLDDMSMA